MGMFGFKLPAIFSNEDKLRGMVPSATVKGTLEIQKQTTLGIRPKEESNTTPLQRVRTFPYVTRGPVTEGVQGKWLGGAGSAQFQRADLRALPLQLSNAFSGLFHSLLLILNKEKRQRFLPGQHLGE